jgi:metal-responsive CopG/Arc/MetJ family transcriptional regulator
MANTVRVMVRIPDSLAEHIDAEVDRLATTQSEVVRRLMIAGMEVEKAQQKRLSVLMQDDKANYTYDGRSRTVEKP